MKIRIGAISGVGSSQLPDVFGASDTNAPSSETPLLSAEETIVLDVLITAAAAAELTPTATGPQRAQAKVAATPTWELPPEITTIQGVPQMSIRKVVTVQAEQGLAASGIDGLIATENQFADMRRAAADKIVDAASFAAAVVVAVPVQLEIGMSRPAADTPPPRMDVVGGGHAGRGNSQSDDEQGAPAAQFAWTESGAATPNKILLAVYQPPLFNRRLETNGVDDALLLALDAARQDAMQVGHVVVPPVPPVQAVVEITVIVPIVPEGRQAPASPLASPDTSTPQPPDTWPHIARWRHMIAARPRLALAATVTTGTAENPDRFRCGQPRYPDLPMSDPRSSGAAERAACWVMADGLIGAVGMTKMSRKARRSARPQVSRCALRPVGSQRIACLTGFSPPWINPPLRM